MLCEAAQVVLYFWDDRDGFHLCGWWFGPDVGSNTVWAFNPGLSWLPPVKGWQQPWSSPSPRTGDPGKGGLEQMLPLSGAKSDFKVTFGRFCDRIPLFDSPFCGR